MIFLMSSERSGSNMLRTIMARHSQVSAPTSPHLVKTIIPLLAGYGDLDDKANFRRLVDHVLEIICTQLGGWTVAFAADDIMASIRDRSFADLFSLIYRMEAEEQGKTLSFVKDNGNMLWPFHLHAMFPDARFVYLVRDPRDCVLSWLNSPSHAGGIAAATAMWQLEQTAVLSFIAVDAPRPPVLIVRYEDLLANPESELDEICNFAGVTREPTMTANFNSDSHRDEARRIANWENVAGEIKRTNHGKFLDQLSRRQVRRIERRLAFEMRVLGYEPVECSEPSSSTDIVGKLTRAFMGSIRLLFGGRQRREELAVRVRRLRSLRKIQADVRRNPQSLFTDRDRDED